MILLTVLFLLFAAVILHHQGKIMTAVENLEAAVAAETTVEGGIVTLLGQLSTQLNDAIKNNDTARIQAVADHISQNTAVLAAAILANTPAAPAPAPAPAPSAPTVVGTPVTNADGSVTTTYSDGSTITTDSTGVVIGTTPPTTP